MINRTNLKLWNKLTEFNTPFFQIIVFFPIYVYPDQKNFDKIFKNQFKIQKS